MSAITVIPLGRNLLRCLAEDIVEEWYKGDDPLSLARVTVILPHRRGTLYLRHYISEIIKTREPYQSEPRPIICPRLLTIEDFVDELAVTLLDHPGRALTLADQAWLLFGLVKEIGIYKDVASTWDRFFAWGVRLASLLDETDREMVDPQDIGYPEDAPAQAHVLLENLKEIHEGFGLTLGKHGFTTQGKRFRLVAERIGDAALPAGPIYLAGFYAMSRSEDRLFRHLFDRGAEILWHADPENLPLLYARWKDEWRVGLAPRDSGGGRPQIHFHETYDLHAELRGVEKILSKDIRLPDECALVLPDPSALIPTLYHIPEGMNLNVSMGYPLERTSIATLFRELVALEEGRSAAGAWYFRDYLSVIRHPYVRRLHTPHGKEGRIVLHLLEESIREYGKPYLTGEEIAGLTAPFGEPGHGRELLTSEGLDLEEAQAHVDQLHASLLKPWQAIETPRDLAAALRNTARFLLLPLLGGAQAGEGDTTPPQPARRGSDEYALDNEFVYALESQVLPNLEDVLFARQIMRKDLLFSLLRNLIHMTRVPFDGRPLKGLQILGLLESRLLSFNKVIVIDVNEGVVPASEEVNPLLPEPLRSAVGLPPREKEEAITRYHFDRLVGSAKEVYLVWQSSTSSSTTGLDGKKTRSRFVETLLWREERKAGRLLEDLVTKEVLSISPKALVREEGVAKTESDIRSLETFIRTHKPGLSATLLNTYVTCPLQFYYHYILELREPQAPDEDVDSGELGRIVHTALETYFAPFKGRTYVPEQDSDRAKLMSIFKRLYKESAKCSALGPEKRFFLEHAAEHRLGTYLGNMEETTFIDSLEREYRAPLVTSLGELTLYGKVDRMDIRDGANIIFDYKTGRVDRFGAGHFESRILNFPLPGAFDYEALVAVKEAFKDIQLPIYVLLVCSALKKDPASTLSAYVELREAGAERYFVGPKKIESVKDSYAAWFAEGLPQLLAYLVDHMLKSPLFYPATDERACAYCPYNPVCRLSFA
jgi:ATP-dependent helicase/nuclease subunit B